MVLNGTNKAAKAIDHLKEIEAKWDKLEGESTDPSTYLEDVLIHNSTTKLKK
ncbi:MAG: hypothetical protein PG981_001444 [Wolbachia endosymbiont of Ctenocephalides orientis wCori]|nr:MAG: hypothetical protein PG981_001444 [Wolbachia endosymbiont of Ctenocephalides orientis wCori]